jgi:hypothetical protein
MTDPHEPQCQAAAQTNRRRTDTGPENAANGALERATGFDWTIHRMLRTKMATATTPRMIAMRIFNQLEDALCAHRNPNTVPS